VTSAGGRPHRPPGANGSGWPGPRADAPTDDQPSAGRRPGLLAGHPASGRVRLARAVVGGGATTSLAVAAHAAAGGAPPAAALVVVGGALLIRLAWGLAGRRRGLPTVLAALTGSQFGLHVTFVLSGHQAANPGHHHVVAPAELLAYGGGARWAGPGLMLAAHLAAVLVTGALLYRAEQLLWAAVAVRAGLLSTTSRVLGPLAAAADLLLRLLASMIVERLPATEARAAAAAAAPPVSLREAPVGRAARRRGPPPGRAALTAA